MALGVITLPLVRHALGLPDMILHNFFRSSASVRLRAALNLKGLSYSHQSYVLRAGEHRSEGYRARNPQGLVPALELPEGSVLSQSLAIIEYLEEVHPEPALLPRNPLDRAWVRSVALSIACDLHPINNLRVLQYLSGELSASEAQVTEWFRHSVAQTYTGLEQQLAQDPRRGRFVYGDEPGLADLCLFAQAANNRRFDVDETPYPTLTAIVEACLQRPEFQDALPENHPHAE